MRVDQPSAMLTDNVHISVAAHNRPDLGGEMTIRPQDVDSAVRVISGDHHHHSYAEVEHLAHLGIVDITETLDLSEDAWGFPRARLHLYVDTLGQDPGEVAG